MDVIRNKAQESNSPIIYSNDPKNIIIDHHSTGFELDKNAVKDAEDKYLDKINQFYLMNPPQAPQNQST